MKAVILAGGYGSRLGEEIAVRPKPMVEIGGHPILWHIMKIYASHGVNDFVICCGFQGHVIKQYFSDYYLHSCDLRFDLAENRMEILGRHAEPWTVTLVDTGIDTGTGGRLKRVRDLIGDETFCFTYGDGVSDVNVTDVVRFHRDQGALVTLTAVQPPARFGALDFDESGSRIQRFKEKRDGMEVWVNGGFFVIEPTAIDYISEEEEMWEAAPLDQLVQEKRVSVFRHGGFWRCIDHLSDKMHLENLWQSGSAPWKVWD